MEIHEKSVSILQVSSGFFLPSAGMQHFTIVSFCVWLAY